MFFYILYMNGGIGDRCGGVGVVYRIRYCSCAKITLHGQTDRALERCLKEYKRALMSDNMYSPVSGSRTCSLPNVLSKM